MSSLCLRLANWRLVQPIRRSWILPPKAFDFSSRPGNASEIRDWAETYFGLLFLRARQILRARQSLTPTTRLEGLHGSIGWADKTTARSPKPASILQAIALVTCSPLRPLIHARHLTPRPVISHPRRLRIRHWPLATVQPPSISSPMIAIQTAIHSRSLRSAEFREGGRPQALSRQAR